MALEYPLYVTLACTASVWAQVAAKHQRRGLSLIALYVLYAVVTLGTLELLRSGEYLSARLVAYCVGHVLLVSVSYWPQLWVHRLQQLRDVWWRLLLGTVLACMVFVVWYFDVAPPSPLVVRGSGRV